MVAARMLIAVVFVLNSLGIVDQTIPAKDLMERGARQFGPSDNAGCSPLDGLQVWMAENLNKDLSVDALARRAAMSPRNFSRVFKKECGTTPAKFVELSRVEAARRQLEQTGRSIKEIAASCGFSGSEIMRRTFLSNLQVTPGAYRLRFRCRSV